MNKFLIFIFIISYKLITAQICDDAQVINNLPFTDVQVNTIDADCDIIGNYCNSSGQAANDTIYEYYSNAFQNIDIILSNVNIQYDWLVSIFLLDTCPDVATTTNCIASASGGELSITNQAIDSNKTYYIVITNLLLLNINSFIYDIEIREHYDYDLSIVEFNDPKSYYDFAISLGETSAWIANNGNYTVDTLNFGLVLNGTTYYNTIIDANLLPGESRRFYPFAHDMSADGPYLTKLFLRNNDMNPNNDTLTKRSHNLYEISSFPYFTDFESGTNGWVTEWKNGSNIRETWEMGVPNANIIDTASSGTHAFVTNLDGNCNINEDSYLVSQSFDFSNISSPMIEFDMWKSLDSTASVYLEYTDTNEIHWVRVGSVGTGTNWYNTFLGQSDDTWLGNSNGWITAKNKIQGAGGKPHVHLRFVFKNMSYNTPEGIAIDNIKIYEAPNHDIGVTNILNPISKCNINNDSITVKITNFSPDTAHSNFIIKALIDNTYELTDTVTQTVQANSTLIYTFRNTFNFNQLKEYKIKATTYLINEDDTTNDADSTVFFNFDNNTLPYFNDFETNNGTWHTTGINSSWEYGTPTDSVITDAASGTKIWATNLSGYHNQPEESYLTSSCFDLSLLTNPLIKFKANYDLYIDNGATSTYVQMYYSNNNGNTWTILGNANNNWYDAGSSWVGKSDNWIEKLYNISNLTNLGNIQLRFKLFALQEKTGFAFDDFTICDAPKAGFIYTASGRNILINDTSINSETYKWFINDTLVSTEQNPTLIVTQDTSKITQVVINNCYSDTISHIIFTSNISNITNGNIRVYPNPTSKYLIIENNKYNISLIQLINSLGQIQISKKVANNYINKIDVSNLYNGVYLLRIETNNGSFTERIIIK